MERRYREPPFPDELVKVPCRHCSSLNTLEASRIDISQGRAWAKCEVCEDWFLVRWEDAAALGIVQPVDPAGPEVPQRD